MSRGNEQPWTVLGVVADLRHGGPLATTAREPRTEAVYFPLEPTEDDLNTAMLVVVRPTGDTVGLAERLRRAAQSVGPRVLIERMRTGDELFGARVITPRRRTVLLALLGGWFDARLRRGVRDDGVRARAPHH